jgi:hypothetical protein
MSDYRHHRAHAGGPADTRIVFIPVPVAGSPKEAARSRPPKYPANQRQPWRPATRPPNKAQRVANFLDAVTRQGAEIDEFMRQARERSQHANR